MAFIENVKKYLGIVWIVLAAFIAYDRIVDAFYKVTSGNLSDQIFGWVLLCVLIPIVFFSLAGFGYLALTGEYAKD